MVSSPLALLDMMRRLGTLSLSAAILSLRLFLYLFSIMLCEVFLMGLPSSSSSSSSSRSSETLRFLAWALDDLELEPSFASGDEAVEALLGEWYCRWGGMAMFRSFSSAAGVNVVAGWRIVLTAAGCCGLVLWGEFTRGLPNRNMGSLLLAGDVLLAAWGGDGSSKANGGESHTEVVKVGGMAGAEEAASKAKGMASGKSQPEDSNWASSEVYELSVLMSAEAEPSSRMPRLESLSPKRFELSSSAMAAVVVAWLRRDCRLEVG